jgi:membrane fusion protein (multidrug efflux system)
LIVLAVLALGLVAFKRASLSAAEASAAAQPEPMEAVTAAVAEEREHGRTTTSIGTVLALRSITVRNELPGTVARVMLETGAVVEAGTVLVALDVSVEEAELRAQQAQASLAETLLGRFERASVNNGVSQADVDRARAERDVALAQVERIRAVIGRKTIRAPFRARLGLSDVHPGQYLDEGTELTTLQGVADAVHVDFTVTQDVAAELAVGDRVVVRTAPDVPPVDARIVAIDARVDPLTRNALVRARLAEQDALAGRSPAPGSSVRVSVPVGAPRRAVVVPVSALRKGPAGDHVFVLEPDADGSVRAHQRSVVSGPALGDEVVIEAGLALGEQLAATGSFKLREGVLVAVADASVAEAGGVR